MRKYAIILLLLLIIPISSAIEQEFTFEKNTTPILPFTCKDSFTGTSCSTAYSCNLTVSYPNGTTLFNDTNISRSGSIYELQLENLTVNGFYSYAGSCENGTDGANSADLQFLVTETGREFSEGQGLASLAILLGVIGLTFFFFIFGFKFTGNPKTMPLALFFIVISVFLALYSLSLGFSYSHDILEYTTVSNAQSSIFTTITFMMVGIGMITFFLMVFSFVKLFGDERKIKQYGEGFDPITDTYQ